MLLLVPVLLYVLFVHTFLICPCRLFSFTLHLQDVLTQPWRNVTEDCTTSDSFIILDAFFEGPSVFMILGDPISGGHNIQMNNNGLYHRDGCAGTKIQVDFSYRRSRKLYIIGRCILGQIVYFRLTTSCNITHHWFFLYVLVDHCPNQTMQSEEI